MDSSALYTKIYSHTASAPEVVESRVESLLPLRYQRRMAELHWWRRHHLAKKIFAVR